MSKLLRSVVVVCLLSVVIPGCDIARCILQSEALRGALSIASGPRVGDGQASSESARKPPQPRAQAGVEVGEIR